MSLNKNPRPAPCHPERDHFAKDQCKPCYDRAWRAKRRKPPKPRKKPVPPLEQARINRENAQRQAAERLEDLAWMAAHGEGLTGAAERIGLTPTSLAGWIRPRDEPLLRQLQRQDVLPVVHTTAAAMLRGIA